MMLDTVTTTPPTTGTAPALLPAFDAAPVRPDDLALLPDVLDAVRAAGSVLLGRFQTDPVLRDLPEVVAAIHANDAAVLEVLRDALMQVRPQAGWVEDELETGVLPAGEWWLTDPAEGNINHIHGMTRLGRHRDPGARQPAGPRRGPPPADR